MKTLFGIILCVTIFAVTFAEEVTPSPSTPINSTSEKTFLRSLSDKWVEARHTVASAAETAGETIKEGAEKIYQGAKDLVHRAGSDKPASPSKST